MAVFGLRLSSLVRFYVWRLRRHPLQELFAGVGIAVGVALIFAVQVANTTISGSAEKLVRGITGDATLQLGARSADGFRQRTAAEVERMPGVREAAPLLRSRVALVGPGGRRQVELVGVTVDIAALGGELTRNFGTGGVQMTDGLALPEDVAEAIGVGAGAPVTVLARGRRQRAEVGAVVASNTAIGVVAGSQTAVSALEVAQRLTGMEGRITQLLVAPRPGRKDEVERGLDTLAGDSLAVTSSDHELDLLRQATQPNDQSTGLFAGISAMVGFLFAFNAMLITASERRRFVAELRMQGFAPRQIVTVLGFEALMLGVLASLAGLGLGELLSRAAFDDVPEYLTLAFPVGSERVVEASTIALALGGGMLAAFAASLRPLLDLRRRAPVDAVFRERGEPGEAIGARTSARLLVAGLLLIAATTALVLLAPEATVVGGVTLALATLLVMPAAFSAAARGVDRLARRSRRANMLALAMMELQSAKTRSIALAAVGALAMYGSVAIGGARSDLVRGFDEHTTEWIQNADLWVTTGGNDLMTDSFEGAGRAVAAVGRAPGVEGVRLQYGGHLDAGDRRLWAIARSPDDPTVLPPSQVVEGDPRLAAERLRGGAWVALSKAFADDRGVGVGDTIGLPSPSGAAQFKVAALTTNLGWPPGAVTFTARDYRRAWRADDPTAIEVDLAAGTTAAEGRRAVERALGPGTGLSVQTRAEREAQYFELGRQGLTRLTQISLLLLIAAALAVACALAATIWQRRPRLAALKIQGFDTWQLWRSLLLETGFVVGVGCAVGAVLGLFGHYLADRYLQLTTGFPAPFSVGGEQLVLAALMVTGIALAVSALPGYAAAQVPMRASFQE
jgi:putative ABC transport system permease protein